MPKRKKGILFLLFFYLAFCISEAGFAASGYVHASGIQILDGEGKNLLLKGLGTGNWMIQEGYMMQSAQFAGTQWKFRKKLVETIGEEKTARFYKSWLDNHFRKIDVDSMAHWGFNCVRVAMHYKVFTLPIEEEPVKGCNTWLEEGFVRLDSLISWCAANRMYVILDLHGAPGGQGKDANISDYDTSKPSLWESGENQSKMIALWHKIAERYATNKWIGGYDLLNETNWNFTGKDGNGVLLRDLYIRTTRSIREVDPNHLIFIEGNWFANDFTGLTPKWDENMAYSFHKYWAFNTEKSIQWMTDFRTRNSCPVWLGEAGENSNRWFTDCIELMEKNNIGWAFWPVKKSGNNNVLKSTTNADYRNLMKYWGGRGTPMSADEAFKALMTFSENHRFENCTILHEVIDAMIRQPHSCETLPYKKHRTENTVYAVDYDMGRAEFAYHDSIDADYHVNTKVNEAWNAGHCYRNDGVDIRPCEDEETNGYCVGWTEDGDWMQYTIQSAMARKYHVALRYSGVSRVAKIHLEINGKPVTGSIELTPAGDQKIWKTCLIPNISVPAGEVKWRVVFEKGGADLNWIKFIQPPKRLFR